VSEKELYYRVISSNVQGSTLIEETQLHKNAIIKSYNNVPYVLSIVIINQRKSNSCNKLIYQHFLLDDCKMSQRQSSTPCHQKILWSAKNLFQSVFVSLKSLPVPNGCYLCMVQFYLLPSPPRTTPGTSPALRARGGELSETVLSRGKAGGANRK